MQPRPPWALWGEKEETLLSLSVEGVGREREERTRERLSLFWVGLGGFGAREDHTWSWVIWKSVGNYARRGVGSGRFNR